MQKIRFMQFVMAAVIVTATAEMSAIGITRRGGAGENFPGTFLCEKHMV